MAAPDGLGDHGRREKAADPTRLKLPLELGSDGAVLERHEVIQHLHHGDVGSAAAPQGGKLDTD